MQCLYVARTIYQVSPRERCPLREVKNVQFVRSWDQNKVSAYGRRPSSEFN